MLFTLLLTVFIEINGVFSKTCTDSSECADEDISGEALCYGYKACQNAQIDGTKALCYGFKGCFGASELKASSSVYCLGNQGCSEATSISAATNAYCDGWYGCAYIENKVEAESQIHCDGDYGCRRTSIESGTNTYCDGKRACYQGTIDAGYNIYCDGDYSCYSAALKAENDVYCYGRGGCRTADIIAYDSVYAYGIFGAWDAKIQAEEVHGYGYLSLVYADLDADDELAMNVYCYGYRGGYGASFTCRDGSICKLDCKGDCCDGMDFICLSGSSCTTFCSDDGVSCPEESTSLSKEDDIKLLKYLENKKIKQKNDKIYKEIEGEFKKDEEELQQKYEDIENNMEDESGLLASFNGDLRILSSGRYINDSLLIIMVFFVAFVINYCYFNMKYKNHEYKTLN